MDKRIFLGTRTYLDAKGNPFDALIYRKNNNRGISARLVYGQMEIYVSDSVRTALVDSFAKDVIQKHPDHMVNRPYLKEGVYCYVLGKKRMFTYDSKLKNVDTFFYLPKATKDPVNVYKKEFLSYLKQRILLLGEKMHLDLSDYVLRTGLFLSYYGVCFPTKKQMKFDYRLYAYKSEISDCILYHEIAHTLDIHHDERFYTIVKMYCPDYDELEDDIRCGRFEGRLDHYVL